MAATTPAWNDEEKHLPAQQVLSGSGLCPPPAQGLPPRETKAGKGAGGTQAEQPQLGGLLLRPFDGPLVDTPTFVGKTLICGGLARVHVADDHDADLLRMLGAAGREKDRCAQGPCP